MNDTKTCSRCKEDFPRSAEFFHRRRGTLDGLIGWCKKCAVEYRRQYLADHPNLHIRAITSKYNMTEEDYVRMQQEQEGRCKICRRLPLGGRRTKLLYVDHDHATGRVRGLLCAQCNTGLGNFWDSAELLLRCVAYLEQRQLDPEWRSPSQAQR